MSNDATPTPYRVGGQTWLLTAVRQADDYVIYGAFPQQHKPPARWQYQGNIRYTPQDGFKWQIQFVSTITGRSDTLADTLRQMEQCAVGQVMMTDTVGRMDRLEAELAHAARLAANTPPGM